MQFTLKVSYLLESEGLAISVVTRKLKRWDDSEEPLIITGRR